MTAAFDPAMQAILDVMARQPPADLRAMPITEARAAFIAQQTPWAWCPRPMAETRELQIAGPAGSIRARLYLPSAEPSHPIVIFAHGGGWTFGSIETHDGTARLLAAHAGAAVLSIDYRLAPEHRFPAGVEDMLAALAFVETGGLGPACDAGRIALAGDSAGANLALGALLRRRDGGGASPATAALFYGCFAPDFDTASHRRLGDGAHVLRTEMMRWYWANLLGSHAPDAAPPVCAPLRAALGGLPPLYLNAAGLDPLLDDTLNLSRRLAEAGIRHTLDVWPGVVHGFMRFARELPLAREAFAAAGRHLRRAFNPQELRT